MMTSDTAMNITNPVLTKIIATIGAPGTASASHDVITHLVEFGATVFRLNFSHGTLEEHAQTLKIIREVENTTDVPLGVMGDLCGPKIRVGKVIPEGVIVNIGDDIIIQAEPVIADKQNKRFSTTCPRLVKDVEIGQKILINDGTIRMLVIDTDNTYTITCRVLTGGLITTSKGINLPQTNLNVEGITERDWECVNWAIENNLDLIALSFVRQADEVIRLKKYIYEQTSKRNQRLIPVIAKIEKPEALTNLDEILIATDAIMVARGDLGIEINLADVPIVQKRIIRRAQQYGRPVIVATQMLESMIHSPTPTRAETSDVANAILDGADAVMLSGETAIGAYPAIAVEIMQTIAASTEAWMKSNNYESTPPVLYPDAQHWSIALAGGVRKIVNDLNAKLVVCWTQSGRTALHLNQHDIPVPILACSPELETRRRLTLLRAVIPFSLPIPLDLTDFMISVDNNLLNMKIPIIRNGDPIVIIAGHPPVANGKAHLIAIHYVGDPSLC